MHRQGTDVDHYVPMLARMYEPRLKGYRTIGYVIEQEAPLPGHETKLYRAHHELSPSRVFVDILSLLLYLFVCSGMLNGAPVRAGWC